MKVCIENSCKILKNHNKKQQQQTYTESLIEVLF